MDGIERDGGGVYLHILSYTFIYLHIVSYTPNYLHIPSYTSIYLKISNIRNRRVDMMSKNDVEK